MRRKMKVSKIKKIYDTPMKLSKEMEKKEFIIPVTKVITVDNIDNIMTTAIEGAIGYWCVLANNTADFQALRERQEDLFTCEAVVTLLMNDLPVKFIDREDDTEYELTLEKLLEGIRLNNENRRWDNDLDNMDADTVDCIIQYSLFGDVIYG